MEELISGVIALVVLIVFIVMAVNIATIKKEAKMTNQYLKAFYNHNIKDEGKAVNISKQVKKSIEPWKCPSCNTVNTINESICEKCGKKSN